MTFAGSMNFPSLLRGKTYKEWQAGKNGSAWKEQLKSDIDEAIKNAATYDDCIELIRAKGYEIKGADFGEKAHKFISFRPLDRERFVRGSAKSLGTEYTKGRIRERIEEKALAKKKSVFRSLPGRSPLSKIIQGKILLTPPRISLLKALA